MASNYNNQQLGMFLRQAREEAGLSQQEAAKQLKLLRNQMVALEEGAFNKLPGDTFVVGYLKNYAKLVGLNPEELAKQYRLQRQQERAELVEKQETISADSVSAGSAIRMGSQHRQHKTGYGLVMSLLVIVGIWWLNYQPVPELIDSTSNVVRVDTADGTTVVGPLAEYGDEELDIGPQLPPLVTSSVTMMGDPEPSLNEYADNELVVESISDSQLSFYFTGDCWVEVRDGDEQIIYASLKKAEDMLQLRGKPPFRVILGYAPAVSLSYNGEPVDIEPNRRDNMAKLILGNS